MSAYLFLWNPAKDPQSFNDFDRALANARAGRPYRTRWICPSKQPTQGDRAFVQRTGLRNNGVFARGLVTRGAHIHRGTQVVGLSLDALLPVGQEISRQQIINSASYERRWMPMASGNVLPESLVQAIDSLWASADADGRRRAAQHETSKENLPDELVGLEGRALQRLIIHRRRERLLRDRKIQNSLHRTKKLVCEVPGCRFDFAEVYGTLGVGYAQVHHLWPLAERDHDRRTTLADLAIVCANCHAMIHRGGECRALATLIPQRKR
jgi:hypothetical protein